MGRTTGQRLEEARKAAGLTTTQVGDALGGVKQQQVSTWEKGTARVPDKHRSRLADVLGIELVDLLTWIADDERRSHGGTRRELSETVQVMERFLSQYEELGHTYRRLDETTDKILTVLEELVTQQAEMLSLLRDRGGERPSL